MSGFHPPDGHNKGQGEVAPSELMEAIVQLLDRGAIISIGPIEDDRSVLVYAAINGRVLATAADNDSDDALIEALNHLTHLL